MVVTPLQLLPKLSLSCKVYDVAKLTLDQDTSSWSSSDLLLTLIDPGVAGIGRGTKIVFEFL